jgi:hypothetical protein
MAIRENGKIAISVCSCTYRKKAAEVAECINPTTQPHAALRYSTRLDSAVPNEEPCKQAHAVSSFCLHADQSKSPIVYLGCSLRPYRPV